MTFDIIDRNTGLSACIDDICEEEWFEGAISYYEFDDFYLNSDGEILLRDDCGNMVHAPEDRFEVVTPTSKPKKLIFSGDGYADGKMVYDMAECPNCGFEYEESDSVWGMPFCPKCGQKLDWTMEDEEPEESENEDAEPEESDVEDANPEEAVPEESENEEAEPEKSEPEPPVVVDEQIAVEIKKANWLNIHCENTEITLLSTEEYESARKFIPRLRTGKRWWLRTPSEFYKRVITVYPDWLYNGDIDYLGTEVICYSDVRPALKFRDTDSASLQIGDKILFAGYIWTIIADNIALCDDIIASCKFNSEERYNDNDFDRSEIKQFLINWLLESVNGSKPKKMVDEDDQRRIG